MEVGDPENVVYLPVVTHEEFKFIILSLAKDHRWWHSKRKENALDLKAWVNCYVLRYTLLEQNDKKQQQSENIRLNIWEEDKQETQQDHPASLRVKW